MFWSPKKLVIVFNVTSPWIFEDGCYITSSISSINQTSSAVSHTLSFSVLSSHLDMFHHVLNFLNGDAQIWTHYAR